MTEVGITVEFPDLGLEMGEFVQVMTAMAEQYRAKIEAEARCDVYTSEAYQSLAHIKGQVEDMKRVRQALKDEIAALREEKRRAE